MSYPERRRRSRGWLIVILGLLLLTALTSWLVIENSRRTEALLTERVGTLLSSYGIDTAVATVSGRDVYLSGTIVTDLSRDTLIAEVAAIEGVRRVFADALRVEVPPERSPQLTITLSETSVTASGVMPETVRPEILSVLEDIAEGRTVLNSLDTAERVRNAPWLGGVLEFVPQFSAEVESGTLNVTGDTLTLEGIILDAERRAALTDAATALTSGLVITNNLAIAEPLLPEPDIRITLQNGVITLSGNVPEEFIPTIVAAAADLYGTANVVNNLRAALTTTPEWLTRLAEALGDLAADITSFDIVIVNGTLTVLGEVSDAAAHSDFMARLESLLGGVFELRDEVVILPPAPENLFLSVREEDDIITLSGTVSRAIQTNLLNTLARRNVESELELSDNVTTPEWLLALIRQLPTYLTTVSDAGMDVDEGVRLLGRVSTRAEKEALESSIRSAIGEDIALENALTVTGVPFRLRWQLVGNDVQLAGNVTEAFGAEVVSLSEALERVNTVSSNLSTYEEALAPAWVNEVLAALDTLLEEVQELTLDFSGSSLNVEGAIMTTAAKSRFDDALAALVGEGITLTNSVIALSNEVEDTPELVTEPTDTADDDVSDEAPEVDTDEVPVTLEMPADPTELADDPEDTTEEASVVTEQSEVDESGTDTPADEVTEVESDDDTSEPEVSEAAPTAESVTDETPEETEEAIVIPAVPEEVTQESTETAPPQPEVVGDEPVETEADDVPEPAVSIEMVTEEETAEESSPDVDSDLSETSEPEITIADVAIDAVAELLDNDSSEPEDAIDEPSEHTGEATIMPDVSEVNLSEEPADEVPLMTDSEQLEADEVDTVETEAADMAEPEPAPEAEVDQPEIDELEGITSPDDPVEAATERSESDVSEPESSESATDQTPDEPAEAAVIPDVSETSDTPDETDDQDAEPEIVITLPTVEPVAAPVNQLRIDGAAGNIVMSGIVPDEGALESLRAAFDGAAVVNVRIDVNAPEVPWLPELLAVASELNTMLSRFSLQVEDTTLYLGGMVTDGEVRDRIGAAVTAALSPPFTVINRLSLQPLVPLSEDGK